MRTGPRAVTVSSFLIALCATSGGVPATALSGPSAAVGAVSAASLGSSVFDDGPWLARLDSALGRLYNLELGAAEAALGDLVRGHADHPSAPLLAALPTWWRILLDPEDTAHDAAMSAAVEDALRRAEARLERDRADYDGRFFKATALAFRSRLRSLRREWVRSALDGRQALDLVRDLAAEDPSDPDLELGLGLYDYFAAVVPDRYPVLRPLAAVFPPGDRERGLERLERAVVEGRFAASEAAYYLLLIRHHLEHDPAGARELARWLRARYPDNALFHVYEGRIEARDGRCDAASRILVDVLARHRAGREGYNDHQAGLARRALVACTTR